MECKSDDNKYTSFPLWFNMGGPNVSNPRKKLPVNLQSPRQLHNLVGRKVTDVESYWKGCHHRLQCRLHDPTLVTCHSLGNKGTSREAYTPSLITLISHSYTLIRPIIQKLLAHIKIIQIQNKIFQGHQFSKVDSINEKIQTQITHLRYIRFISCP
uniref:Uncharacterized protein n=1 Tax=Solanum tuberosum TaxID=4113 RepID=M0ZHE7_SOLTU